MICSIRWSVWISRKQWEDYLVRLSMLEINGFCVPWISPWNTSISPKIYRSIFNIYILDYNTFFLVLNTNSTSLFIENTKLDLKSGVKLMFLVLLLQAQQTPFRSYLTDMLALVSSLGFEFDYPLWIYFHEYLLFIACYTILQGNDKINSLFSLK